MSDFRRVAAVLAGVLGGAQALLFCWNPAHARAVVGLSDTDVPTALAGYQSSGDYSQPAAVRDALPGATILSRTYQDVGAKTADSSTAPLDFVLVSGASRDSLHDPRYCLTGAGWRLSDVHEETLPGTTAKMAVCEAATTGSAPDMTIGYFYIVNSKVISDPTQIRATLLWSALLGRTNAPAYFFRFVQPIVMSGAAAGDGPTKHARLSAFAGQMYAALRGKCASQE
jgi:hypothetical protein